MRMVLVFAVAVGIFTTVAGARTAVTRSPSPIAFTSRVIAAGATPTVLAVEDLNGDGQPDIAVANDEAATVTVLLGDGRGHFTAARGSPFSCGEHPNDIAVADMNADGHPDLVIANTGTPYLTVLLGDGRGGFTPAPHSPFATRSIPHVHGVAVGDFMGDGKPAVVTDSWGQNEVLLIPSDGRGSLLPTSQPFSTGKRPYQRVRSADFNGDGKPDVVTTNQDGNTVTILLGTGRGGFTEAPGSPFPAGAAPWSLAIDDINRDGALDLAVVPYAPAVADPAKVGLTILWGDGHGRFSAMRGSPLPLTGCAGPDRVVVGDLTGRGLRDVVVSCAQNDALVLFVAQGDGTFQTERYPVQTGWSALVAADLGHAGKDDLIVSNRANGTITVLSAR